MTPRPDPNDIPLTAKLVISAIDRVREKHTRPHTSGSGTVRPHEGDLLVLAGDAIDETVQHYVADRVKAVAADLVAHQASRYVEAIDAVLAAGVDSPDVDRWRGHAEAYRSTAEALCRDFDLPVEMAAFRTVAWRTANGVRS
jgi:hypothetical protein